MSEYNDVIAGKLRLKGKGTLDVKSGGVTKKKKHKKHYDKLFTGSDYSTDLAEEDLSVNDVVKMQRLAKSATKSHRNWIQEFNQYLANLTEQYGIPKVGPG